MVGYYDDTGPQEVGTRGIRGAGVQKARRGRWEGGRGGKGEGWVSPSRALIRLRRRHFNARSEDSLHFHSARIGQRRAEVSIRGGSRLEGERIGRWVPQIGVGVGVEVRAKDGGHQRSVTVEARVVREGSGLAVMVVVKGAVENRCVGWTYTTVSMRMQRSRRP